MKALRRLYIWLLSVMPQGAALRFDYIVRCRRLPNTRRPERFTEKVLWRKLKDRRELVAVGTNKLAGKEYAAATLGDMAVGIPETLWVGDARGVAQAVRSVGKQSGLKWVLKPTSLGGGLVLFGEGGEVDEGSLRDFVRTAARTTRLFRNIGGLAWTEAERPFMIESRLGDGNSLLADFKIHVFGGTARYITLYTGRGGELSSHNYRVGADSSRLVRDGALGMGQLETMVMAAEKLAAHADYMRVDFYANDQGVFFGELTPLPRFEAAERATALDVELGALWRLDA